MHCVAINYSANVRQTWVLGRGNDVRRLKTTCFFLRSRFWISLLLYISLIPTQPSTNVPPYVSSFFSLHRPNIYSFDRVTRNFWDITRAASRHIHTTKRKKRIIMDWLDRPSKMYVNVRKSAVTQALAEPSLDQIRIGQNFNRE